GLAGRDFDHGDLQAASGFVAADQEFTQFSATDVSVDAPFRYLVHSLPISPPCGDRSLLRTAQRVVCIGFVAPKTGTKKSASIDPPLWMTPDGASVGRPVVLSDQQVSSPGD
ncbi:MAG: hypothetical protein KJ945_03920, partial [Gammaproteobacteria bacterium]|nr:hypothetical protein [Gammaproteobacteria bacterium]